MKGVIGRILFNTPLYPLARSIYRKAKGGKSLASPIEVSFYSNVIAAGDLVFDIGANVGQKAEVFLKCGARIVAAEPNPLCHPILDFEFKSNRNFTLLPKAVGATEGELDLNIVGIATTASVLDNWTYLGAGYEGGGKPEKVKVPVTTIDKMIAEYGVPAFVKIDVEGFEPEVLQGLSQPVALLSFEYGMEGSGKERLMECLNRLASFSDILINALRTDSNGYACGFALDGFVPFSAFKPEALPVGGDCFVKMSAPKALKTA